MIFGSSKNFLERQHVIIFDGPDMCGKTNIAQELAYKTGITYFKNNLERDAFVSEPQYFSNASKYVDTYMSNFLYLTKISVIFDRNYPSEYVYPVVFNRQRNLDVLRHIDEIHAKIGTVIVIPYRTSFANIIDDVHNNITETLLKQIDDLYIEFCDWTRCRTYRLCVDDQNLNREVNDIINFIKGPLR